MKNRNSYKEVLKYDIDDINIEDNVDFEIDINDSDPKSRFKYKNYDNTPGIGVALYKDESFESLLKRFKKSVMESNIIKQYQDNLVFVKPSVERRMKKSIRKFKARRSSQNYK